MNLIRWEPILELGEILLGYREQENPPRLSDDSDATNYWTPAVDLSEQSDEYLIATALPGVRMEDVDITIEDGVLTISGERRQGLECGDDELCAESFYGCFASSVSLPADADVRRVRAEADRGVVSIHVPKVGASSGWF